MITVLMVLDAVVGLLLIASVIMQTPKSPVWAWAAAVILYLAAVPEAWMLFWLG